MREFLEMGGYATYVWSAFGIVAVAMIVTAIVARRADRRSLDAVHHENGRTQ